MEKFIGNWWSGAHADLEPVGEAGKGYKAANFSGVGTDFPALQDVIKYVVDAGKSKADKEDIGKVNYNRGLFNAVIMAEAIRVAQEKSGVKAVTGKEMRLGLEGFNLDEARLKEIGLEGFTAPIAASCADHEGAGSIFIQEWDGKDWSRTSDLIPPMTDVVKPLLQAAADKYVSEQTDWQTQDCG